MKSFSAPLHDILFSLDHIAQANQLVDWDSVFVKEMGEHFSAFAEKEIAPLDERGDVQGCRLENNRVLMPDGFVEVYKAYCEQGWPGLHAPTRYGGQGLGAAVQSITTEIFAGACHSFQMVAGLVPGAIRTLQYFGSEQQQSQFIPLLASGEALATMCLTEAGAGSDLSLIRCSGKECNGRWTLTGEKIFISGGDHDLSEDILHLVLARTSDQGVKGLSLFICRGTLENGERNRINVSRIEEKMGIKASPTCQMTFNNADAELVGEPGEGLIAMFTLMNHARLDVALQGVAHAARSYDIANAYASDRAQGKKADGTAANLVDHADVQRMLDEIDRLTLSARAIAHTALVKMEQGDCVDLVEFLTPIAKVYCTEAGIKSAEIGIQVLGGYGYLREYRLEQTYRDARITAIYEGANGIHSKALITRLLKTGAADAFEKFVTAEYSESKAESIAECLNIWKESRYFLQGQNAPEKYADDFMKLTAEVLLCCIGLRMMNASPSHSDPDRIIRVGKQIVRNSQLNASWRSQCISNMQSI